MSIDGSHECQCGRLCSGRAVPDTLAAVAKALAATDPVVGPFRFTEPRIDPLNFDEKQRSTSRRICGLCKARSPHQGENVLHTKDCPWIPAKKLLAALAADQPAAKESK